MRPDKQEEMERIDQVVFQYQAGDQASGEEILRLFGCHPSQKKLGAFIGKYYKILRYGRLNFKDRDTREFLRCFISDPKIRQAMIPFYQYKDTKRAARKAITYTSEQLRIVEDEDLKQDLRMLLLQQAMRYKKKKKKVGFTGYLYNSYRYAVKNYIKDMFKKPEPFMHMNSTMIRIGEDVLEDKHSLIDIGEQAFVDTPILEFDDQLGNSWIRGLTCGEEFVTLNNMERLILKLHFEDGHTDGQIAKYTNMHINTIFKYRKRAQEKIKEQVARLIEEGYYG